MCRSRLIPKNAYHSCVFDDFSSTPKIACEKTIFSPFSSRCTEALNPGKSAHTLFACFLSVYSCINLPGTLYWATMRQINELGGSVRKTEKSTPVVFWRIYVDGIEVNAGEQEAQTPEAEG